MDRRTADAIRVLFLEDSPTEVEILVRELRRAGLELEWKTVDTREAFVSELSGPIDLILADYTLPGLGALDALRILQERKLDIPLIVVTGRAGEDQIVDSMQHGAWDYLLKDRLRRLGPSAKRALTERRVRREKKEAEEALRKSETHFRALIENVSDLIVILGAEGDVRYVSPSIRAIGGYDPEELTGRSILELVHPTERHALATRVQDVIADPGGEPTTTVYRFRRRDGSWCLIEALSRNAVDVPGIDGIVVNARDITDKRETDEQLRQAQKMEAVGQLTGGVAHDFNNLLTVVLGGLEAIVDELPADSEARKLGELALTATERGATLTQRLLAFSRRQSLRPSVVDLAELVEGMRGLLSRTLGETIEIETSRGSALWKCLVDVSQMETVLLNLAINARDAMPDGGLLRIEVANATREEQARVGREGGPAGPFVVLRVTDTGHGMSPDVRARAFDPFFTTKEVGKGTGLGLSMIYGFVTQSGGHVRLASDPGEGATVEVYLPRAVVDEVPEAGPAEGSPRPRGAGERILVVEDDDGVRALVETILTSLGYRATTLRNAHEALAILDGPEAFDLLFTDVVLPGGMSGFELARRARDLRPGLKILFTSGYSEEAIDRLGRLEGDWDLIEKPFHLDALADWIRRVLDA